MVTPALDSSHDCWEDDMKCMEADSGGLPQHVRRSLSKVETPVWMSASLGMVAGCAKVFQELRCVNTVNVILDA